MKFSGLVALVLFSLIRISFGGSMLGVKITIAPDVQVEAEVAVTDQERAAGLMFRESLPAMGGMLFIFHELDNHSFWMKNTLIPLDIIWLNERKEIVYWVTADPCKNDPCAFYAPLQRAKYVLEVNGGFVKKHGLRMGQHLDFDLPSGI